MFGGKAMFFENQGGDVQNSFRIQAGAATYPYDNLFLAGYSNAGATRGTGIKFFTAPAGGGQIARVTIDPDGNVRIGTPAPGIAKLDVGIDNTSPYAVRGVSSGSTIGVYGLSAAGGYGVYGRSSGGYGVVGQSDTSVGVYGVSSSGIAGYFNGKVVITTLGAAGGTSLCVNTSNEVAACSSSLRYKTDVQPFVGGLDILQRLRPIAFT